MTLGKKHGTKWTYETGCRCGECTAAVTRDMKKHFGMAKEKFARGEFEISKHGTTYSYRLGCRCEPCVEGKRAYYHNYERKNHKLISFEDLKKLEADQDGKCAICLRAAKGGLNVDHDHKTGVVRGLLCTGCNTALGRFGDNLEGVQKVIEYLIKAQKK